MINRHTFSTVLSIVIPLAFFIVVNWKIIRKAGRPGWEALIPFYNGWGIAEVSGRPGIIGATAYGIFFSLRFLDPLSRGTIAVLTDILTIVGFIMLTFISLGLAKHFKKSAGFKLLIVVLPFIGFSVLAFDSSRYKSKVN